MGREGKAVKEEAQQDGLEAALLLWLQDAYVDERREGYDHQSGGQGGNANGGKQFPTLVKEDQQ